jgi:hypothetical protein
MATVAAQSFDERKTAWTPRHTVALVAILAAIAVLGVALPWAAHGASGYRHARLLAWLATLALFTGFALVVGHGLTGLARGIFVDDRNKLSVSRLQMFLWTVLVLSAYLSASLANVGLGAVEPLAVRVPQPLWLAMGVSTSSLVASPLVLHRVKGKGVALNDAPHESRWTDLVRGEERGFVNVVDLGKLQLLLVTVVLVLAYAIVVGHALADDGKIVTSLPGIDDAFVIMLGISHAGYIAKKAVPVPKHARA